ncbi:hypothetical protein [Arthrobacter sp. NPDC057013]|uniref:hypothetical protein n=1 Tax=Arthrobacter sp. NPDC057013 TaxID=3345999 RepID=UPI0036331A93
MSVTRTVVRGVERHGVVQEIGEEWVLMAAVRDGGYLNGYMALRLDLIRRVRAAHGLEDFLRRRPDWPPAPLASGISTGAQGILERGTENSQVLSVFLEEKWEGIFFVGVPVKFSKKTVDMVTIGKNARWEEGTFKVRYKDLSQISFGGDYEKALWAAVGGPASVPV